MSTTTIHEPVSTRTVIIQAAAELLIKGGREAVSTRAVAEAAKIQVPTIYRQFGDMHGLLDAVISYELELYLQKREYANQPDDPVEALRAGWNCTVGFGLSYPAFYAIMFSDGQPDAQFTAMRETIAFVQSLVQRVAEAGRLRINVGYATQMIHAACSGVILTLLQQAPEVRDLTLSAMTREAMLASVLIPEDGLNDAEDMHSAKPQQWAASRAVALKAALPEVSGLSTGEQALLSEWLDRISAPTR